MTPKEKAALPGGSISTPNAGKSTKETSILQELLYRSINRFDAEKLGDHCLHSTISVLRKKGIGIAQERERVPTRFGTKVSVCRYWIPPESRVKALELLGGAS